jgi:hypothetical protein
MEKTKPRTENHERALAFAREAFENTGRVDPFILAVHPIQGRIMPILLEGKLLESEAGKNLIESFLLRLAHMGHSEIFYGSEMWRVQGEKGRSLEEFWDEIRKWKEEHDGSLAEYPGRIEGVQVSRYTAEGDVVSWAEITGEDKNRALGEWETYAYEDSESDGRFAQIFKRAGELQGNGHGIREEVEPDKQTEE